ncbi:hypothetical protein BJ878DRAFT_423965 [Calycina marina]|uniref:DUF676 domain-containing protein n=1 Tax=Calycina marina TaxID=1763456 RepID=A0A9P7Z0E2_9HELO|nr:hypothetical protein BJ878DRAFT_423965 [Calycina marina]
MPKTLLLCFIHGFKGDEETFYEFPKHLQGLVSNERDDLDVHTAVYPKYETRGDLALSVETFREWYMLQERVTDIESTAANTSAIRHPSVSVIIVAHSMGGFVAADTLFSVLDNRPISPDPAINLMFPLIHGILAFDTPFNGLSRSMFAYGAFSQYQNISSLWSVASTISTFGAGATASTMVDQTTNHNPMFKRWHAIAARSGTYGAIVAGGVAAYMNRQQIAQGLSMVSRDNITQSWQKVNKENISQGLAYVSRDSIGEGFAWMGGHLKFVGALMKQAQLKTRLERLSQLKGVGVANLYTSLGENGYWTGGYFVPKRTFSAIPMEKDTGAMFEEQPNAKAANEIEAHCSMFRIDKNPQYEEMTMRSRDLVLKWMAGDPRRIVDDYKPPIQQRKQSISEKQLFDDDGKLTDAGKTEAVGDGTSEDELQLQAILSSTSMPLPEDGGVDEGALKAAAAVPLPIDEEASMTWKSRITKPFSGISLSSVPRPSVSLPSMPSRPSFSMPAFRNPMKAAKGTPNVVDEVAEMPAEQHLQKTTTQDDASKVPLPVKVLDEPAENIVSSPSVDSSAMDAHEIAKDG